MTALATTPSDGFDFDVPTLVIGAGASGLVAALSVKDAGGEVLVIEADPVPSGSTALSAGLIPAAGTRFQKAAGIDDTPEVFAADIQRKAKGENPDALVQLQRLRAQVRLRHPGKRDGSPGSPVLPERRQPSLRHEDRVRCH